MCERALPFSLTQPGVNFINILRAAFVRADPKSVKKTDNLTVFFAFLEYSCVKAACRMLMKLTLGSNFKTGSNPEMGKPQK